MKVEKAYFDDLEDEFWIVKYGEMIIFKSKDKEKVKKFLKNQGYDNTIFSS